jgi:WD40 repeat protein
MKVSCNFHSFPRIGNAFFGFAIALAFGLVGANCRLATAEDPPADPPADSPSFSTQIAPILLEQCVACHGAKKAEGGYRLDTYEQMLKAGDSGETPVAATGDEVSELVRRLTAEEYERMPAESEPLLPEQIDAIKKWVTAGAKFDGERPGDLLATVIPPPTYPTPPQSYGAIFPITAMAFSPDGKQAVASGYHEITIWDLQSGELVRRIPNLGQRIFGVAFNSAGDQLAIACGEPGRSGEVRLVDFATGEVRGVIARSLDVATDVAYRPGSDELAVASADNLIRVINVTSMDEVRVLTSHADWVTDIAWSDDGTRLVSSSRDKSAKVYDGQTGELLVSFQGHGTSVGGVTFTPDGKQVMSVGGDNKLHRWDVESGKAVATIPLGGTGFKIQRRADKVIVPCSDHRLVGIDIATNKISQSMELAGEWVLSAAIDAEGTRVLAGAYDGRVGLWNLSDGQVLQTWTAIP